MKIMPRRVVGIAVVWATLWLAFWVVIGTIIGLVDPDSMDPGEPVGMVAIFGPMGPLSSGAFAGLLALGARDASRRPSFFRIAGFGVLGTAIVQLAYLGHGDNGLLANVQMAMLFSVIGGIITAVWFVVTRFGRVADVGSDAW